MNQYYADRAKETGKQLEFAKVGYAQKIKELGERLASGKTEEYEEIFAEMDESIKAIKALQESYEYNKKNTRGEE